MKLPSRFYPIVDPAGGDLPLELATAMLEAGVRIMQLRLKDVSSRDFLAAARAISKLCHQHGATLIINDRVDIALLSDAHGVHLGQSDLPIEAARRLLGPDKIIGISTHNLDHARAAEAAGADYLGFGPMYPGGLKNTATGQGLERLVQVRAAVTIPIVAIGAITAVTAPEVLAAGADAVAIISDVVKATDVRAKIRWLLKLDRPTPCAS